MYPRFRPDLAADIEGSLGELSTFHNAFRYWADGVSPATAVLPPGWEQRLIPLSSENTAGAIGWCLEPHDLAFSKLAARREKDLVFVRGLLRHRMIRRIESTPDESLRERVREALALCARDD